MQDFDLLHFCFKDPIILERCVVSIDNEFEEAFEVMDGNKESHIFKVLNLVSISIDTFLGISWTARSDVHSEIDCLTFKIIHVTFTLWLLFL